MIESYKIIEQAERAGRSAVGKYACIYS